MYQIEISLSPLLYEHRAIKDNHIAVVVDILRATTSICAAFAAGAAKIVPLDSLEKLPQYRQMGYMLAAERNGEKIADAEYGNSPTEYNRSDLQGERLAYSSTNGTVCLLKAQDADQVWVGCFSNLSAIAKKIAQEPQDVVILCSGWKQEFSLEDTLFAGALAERLMKSGAHESTNDAVWMALDLWHNAQKDLYGYCQKASHVKRLKRLNYDNDIRFALTPDTCPIVPEMKNGVLVLEGISETQESNF